MTGAHDEKTAHKSDGDEDSAETMPLPPEKSVRVAADAPSTQDGAEAPQRATNEEATSAQAASPPAAGSSPEAHALMEDSGVLELIETTPAPVTMPVRASETPDPPATSPAPLRRPPPLPSSARPSQVRAAVPPPLPSASRTTSRMLSQAQPAPVGANLTAQMVPLPDVPPPPSRAIEQERFTPEAAITAARKYVEQAASGDRVALARARTELGILLEVVGKDPVGALTEYRAAHSIAAHLLAPLAGARRLTPLRPAAPALALLEAELRASNEPATQVVRQLELGMLLASSTAPSERTWQAYREVLALRPNHPGALRGLETALITAPRAAETSLQLETLAAHLETMAAAFRDDTRLSAWLEVERGQLLEKLGRPDAARAAFEAALALDGQIGPVRDATTQHLLLQGQIEALVKAWVSEAGLERDGARAARLLYAAGRLAAERLDQKLNAVELFERAAGSGAAADSIRRASLRELFRLYEGLGNIEAAVATGTKVLAFARDTELAHWHRRLVQGCEALGRFDEMAVHAHYVLSAEPDDEPMREKLDCALAALGQHEQRVAMFTDQATRASPQAARIDLLLRAATIAEHYMGRPDVALLSLRSAFAIDASHPDTTDAIVRLLTPGTPPSPTDPDDPSRVRARIDFYVEAATAAADPARKIAHLEKLALIWEDEVRAPEHALAVFSEILTIEPNRRSAILGLARCAARAGNAHELLRALVLEANFAGDDICLERSLLLRAADVALGQLGEADTALDLVKRVLARTGGDLIALRAAFRIHERAGRQAEALAQLRLLLGQNRKGQTNYPVQAEIARFLEERMHRTADALTAWREAHRMDSSNPTPRAEIRRILLASGDYHAFAEELAALATATTNPVERGELLLEAAEIYDDRLNDAERAIPLLADARTCLPDEPSIAERLDRAYLRTGKRAERLALLHATESPDPRSQLALASLQAEDRDPAKALKRLATLSLHDAAGVAALRILEHALRRTERWNDLDALLRKQIECFATLEAKLGSVFELVALEEYGETRAPEGQPSAIELLAKFAPENFLYYELLLKKCGLDFEGTTPFQVVTGSLEALAAAIPDPLAAAALQLAAALLIEHHDEGNLQAQALLAYAMALESWPDSLTAARGARRMALRLGESETFVKAATALGGLEMDPTTRCERLLEAADGYRRRPEDAARALDLVCRALGEDPNSVPAADAVIALVGNGLDAGKATETLRSALDRTLVPDQAARLGAALAHVAIAHLGDQTVALEALRRARKRAPKHVGNLLALADVSTALGLHAEAVEAATSAMGISRDPAERFRAAIALAEIHARSPAFRETARREAMEAEKLAEQVGAASGDMVARLGDVYRTLGDEQSAERVLIQAVVLNGENTVALDRLCSMYGTGREAGERVASALGKVMTLAESSGHPKRPEWLAALGKVEATLLGRPAEGLARLHEAIRLAPSHVAIYQALVEAHGSAHDEAVREMTGMLADFCRSSPTSEQVKGILTLLSHECRQAQRPETAAVADELLTFLGKAGLGADASDRTRSQTLPMRAPMPASLSRDTMVSSLLPNTAQTSLLEVAALLWETIAKLVRQEPETLGAPSRDRITARAAHPARMLADRVARAFGELRFDLYVEATATQVPRLLPGDPPALILPQGFGNLSEVEQAADLARLLTYVALDIPWAEDAPAEDVDGILFGALRAGSDLWGNGELSPNAEMAASAWRVRIAKAAGRKVKRALEETATRIRPQADTTAWRQAMRITGLRTAYVATGDLTATLSQAIRADRELAQASRDILAAKVFEHPITRDVVLFALSDSALALRRSAGTA
jgi:cellulose synthase operon protein C